MRIGSLCTGYGGLDSAVAQHYGATLAWVSDTEPAACVVLSALHPDVPNLGDLTAVDWSNVEPVDVLTAGFPCQPFSHAGKRLGEKDERHLWPYIADGIGVLRPGIVVFENVLGLLSLGLNQVVTDLNWLGYDVQWIVVRASDAGAPHQRARVFIMGVDRERGLCSGTDRRRGLDRDPSSGGLLPPSSQGRDDDEGAGLPLRHAGVLRWDGSTGASGGRTTSGDGGVASEWIGSSGVLGEGSSVLDRQGCNRGRGPAPASVGGLGTTSAEWSGGVDGVDRSSGSDVVFADQGDEPDWPGDATAGVAGSPVSGCYPMGRVVGTGGWTVRADGVLGQGSDLRDDGGGAHLRASDGAPHQRARIFIVATDTSGAALGQHPGEPSPQEARSIGRDRLEDSRGERADRNGRPTPDADGRGHGREQDADRVDRVDDRDAGTARQRQRARGESHAGSDQPAADSTRGPGRARQGRRLSKPEGTAGLAAHDLGATADADTLGRERSGAARRRGRGPEDDSATTTDADGWRREDGTQLDREPLEDPTDGHPRGRHADGRDGATDWGKYEPAIRRWEALTRPAPAPTVAGRNGRPRLSPYFVEWLMGLEPGHVTGHGLTIPQQLKMLGNGVVPQQALLALSLLDPIEGRAAA